ncbi:MAG: hypothetical protein AAFR60_03190, partial [Pseudomonadota bacterium]
IFIRAPDGCTVGKWELGLSSFSGSSDRATGNIAFESDCQAFKLVTTHPPQPKHGDFDSGMINSCGLDRTLISEPGKAQQFQRYYTYEVRRAQPGNCSVTLLVPRLVKRLSLSKLEMDIFVGPGADRVRLASSGDYRARIDGRFLSDGFNFQTHRVQVLFTSRQNAFWEQVLTIVFAALIGVGAAAMLQAIA